jgi:hypothetical protein
MVCQIRIKGHLELARQTGLGPHQYAARHWGDAASKNLLLRDRHTKAKLLITVSSHGLPVELLLNP